MRHARHAPASAHNVMRTTHHTWIAHVLETVLHTRHTQQHAQVYNILYIHTSTSDTHSQLFVCPRRMPAPIYTTAHAKSNMISASMPTPGYHANATTCTHTTCLLRVALPSILCESSTQDRRLKHAQDNNDQLHPDIHGGHSSSVSPFTQQHTNRQRVTTAKHKHIIPNLSSLRQRRRSTRRGSAAAAGGTRWWSEPRKFCRELMGVPRNGGRK